MPTESGPNVVANGVVLMNRVGGDLVGSSLLGNGKAKEEMIICGGKIFCFHGNLCIQYTTVDIPYIQFCNYKFF